MQGGGGGETEGGGGLTPHIFTRQSVKWTVVR